MLFILLWVLCNERHMLRCLSLWLLATLRLSLKFPSNLLYHRPGFSHCPQITQMVRMWIVLPDVEVLVYINEHAVFKGCDKKWPSFRHVIKYQTLYVYFLVTVKEPTFCKTLKYLQPLHCLEYQAACDYFLTCVIWCKLCFILVN